MSEIEATKTILGRLIGFPTISSRSNLEMIDYLADRLETAGARVDIFSDASGAKANLFATLGPQADGGIVLSGHTDVVPVADQGWATDPFEMIERDGKLFGRGACDMKGFIAAALALAPALARQEKARPLHFAFTYDEETGCMGARELARQLLARNIRPAMAIIGEPTAMRVIEGHKGCYEYTTRFSGLEGHGSNPDRGVNAVEYAVRYVSRLLELKERLRRNAPAGSRFEPPWTTISTGAIVGGIVHNVIPRTARVDWEMRPVRSSDAKMVKSELESYCADVLLPRMREVAPDADIVTEVIGEVDGLIPASENEARDIALELTGTDTADVAAFGTEAGIFQSLGMSVAVCGPGSIEQAHRPNEYVSLSQLAKCLETLRGLGAKLVT